MNPSDIRTQRRLAAIEAATTDRALTIVELSAAIYLNENGTRDYLRALVAEGAMHIQDWHVGVKGHPTPFYKWGKGRNKSKPARQRRTVEWRVRFARMKADGDAYDRFLAMHRARYAVKRARKAPNTWLSALSGVTHGR